jgi:hypothetical protein
MQVYENRIEWNEPSACLCCAKDNVRTVYFDRKVTRNAQRAGCCSPACTHCSLCPDCCSMFGQAVVIFGGNTCGCCCRKYIMIQGWEDAEAIAAQIVKQRKVCLGQVGLALDDAPELGQRMQRKEQYAAI